MQSITVSLSQSLSLVCVTAVKIQYCRAAIWITVTSSIVTEFVAGCLRMKQERSEIAYIRQGEYGLDPESVSRYGLQIRTLDSH